MDAPLCMVLGHAPRGMADCRPFENRVEQEWFILALRMKVFTKMLRNAAGLLGIGLLYLTPICLAGSSAAGQKDPAADDIRFTLRLRNEEFLRMVVPKEKFLLGLARNITEEFRIRKFDGGELSALNIDVLISPKQMLVNAYVREMEKLTALAGKISGLETKARKRLDWPSIEALAELRKRVFTILDSRTVSPSDSLLTREAGTQTESAAGFQGAVVSSRPPAVFREFAETLLDQWKYNHLLDSKLAQTRYELIRTKLLKSAKPQEAQRMFRRDLRTALESYAAGDFALSRLQFRDVIAAYPGIQTVDDILFYAGESSFGLNFLDESLETYRELATRYPHSVYSGKALAKIIFIRYIYGQTDSMVQTYRRMQDFQRMAPAQNVLDDETFGVASYLVGLSEFNRNSFVQALYAFQQVPPGTSYKPPAQYLSAACHSNMKNDDAALAIYGLLAEPPAGKKRNPIEIQVRNNALMKMGFIYYERGDNARAISLFGRVDKEFQSNDLNLLGKAWSAYRSGKPVEALQNAEALLDHSLLSNYLYEAKVLAARSKELLGQSDEAVSDLEQVRTAGTSPLSDRWAAPASDSPGDAAGTQVSDPAGTIQLYSEASRIFRFLHTANGSVFPPPAGEEKPPETTRLLDGKIGVLDSLERMAEERKSPLILDSVRKLRGSAIQALQLQSRTEPGELPENVDDPVIRRMGLSSYMRYLFGTLLDDAVSEKKKIVSNIAELERMEAEPLASDQTGLRIRMEIRRDDLTETWLKLNQYEVWLRENMPQAFRVEIDRWANFSEYGISNINFSRIREIDGQMAVLSGTVRQIDQVYRAKKIELGKRIEALLEDVNLIERQMQAEMQKKNEQEKDKRFNSEYFEKSIRESPLSEPPSKTEAGKDPRP
jgi:TolA-binding protein